MKATNQELRAALEACATTIEGYFQNSKGPECGALLRAGREARALLNRKSCENCEFGVPDFDDKVTCNYKKGHGLPWDRNCIPITLEKDYAEECDCYAEEGDCYKERADK